MGFDFANPSLSDSVYGCRVGRTTATQSISHATDTAISFQSGAELWDPKGMWVSGTPTRVTIQKAGIYVVNGCISWADSSAGSYRITSLRVNGSTRIGIVSSMANTGSFTTRHAVGATVELSVSDYIELMVQHDNASSALDVNLLGQASPFLSVSCIGQL